MANPNPEIWGAPSSWAYNNMSYGLETTVAKLANADKPKCKNFGSTSYDDYQQTLFSAVQHNFIALNTPLDRSLCPCGIAPEVSPWAKIAIFNENNNLSATPSRIIEKPNENTNWFFCNRRGADNNAFYYTRDYTYSTDGGLKYQQFAPKAATTSMIYNQCLRVAPYMSYGIKSLLLSIQVRCIAHNASNPITGTTWRSLDEWKNNYPTYDICGLRFFVRNCTAINNTTLALTYNNDIVQTGGYKSGNIAVYQTIKVLNNGENVDTEFLTLSMSDRADGRTGTIFDVSPEIYNWDDGRNNRPIYPCWNYFTGQTMNVYKPTSDPEAYYFYKIPYSDDTYDKIMKITACFGCFFTPTNKYQFAYDMLDNDLYLTVLDENGVAHGQYTHGAANANNSLYSKSSIREIDYNPDTPPSPVDPNTYSNSSYFRFVALGSVGNKRYALGVMDVNGLISDLWSLLTTFSQDSFDNFTQKVQAGFLVTNPIDSIVSLLCFPFPIPHNGDNVPIKLGKYDMTARGNTVIQSTYTINFTGVPIFPRFGNCYLDYEPYTNYEVYIPFCGTVPLKAADIIGHTLNVKLIVDLYTGSCTGYILADDLVIETITGTVAITVPITGMDSSTINSQIVNANLNYKSSQYSAGAAIGSMVSVSGFIGALSNPAEAVNKIAQSQITEERTQYELTHIPTQPHIIGASSPALGWCCDTIARVMIYYPTGDVITDSKPPSLINEKIKSFGDLNGFSCLKWGKVREFSGFTLGNIKLDGVPCTESERARLKQLFSTGVYL